MAHLIRFDEDKCKELVELGRRDLYFFCKGILGFADLTEDFHWELGARFVMRGSIRACSRRCAARVS